MDLIKNIGAGIVLTGTALILPEVTFLGLDFTTLDTNAVAIIQLGIMIIALGLILKEILGVENGKGGIYK